MNKQFSKSILLQNSLTALFLLLFQTGVWAADTLVVGFPSLSMSTIMPHIAGGIRVLQRRRSRSNDQAFRERIY